MSAVQRPQKASKPCPSCGEAPETERVRLCFRGFFSPKATSPLARKKPTPGTLISFPDLDQQPKKIERNRFRNLLLGLLNSQSFRAK